MKKLLLIILLAVCAINSYAQQNRVINLAYNADSTVYAKNDIYLFNEEETPLTATVIEIGRWSKVIDQETYYENGMKMWVSEYNREGIKEKTTYYDGSKQEKIKSGVFYNLDGAISSQFAYDAKGYLVKN